MTFVSYNLHMWCPSA